MNWKTLENIGLTAWVVLCFYIVSTFAVTSTVVALDALERYRERQAQRATQEQPPAETEVVDDVP